MRNLYYFVEKKSNNIKKNENFTQNESKIALQVEWKSLKIAGSVHFKGHER